MKQFLLIILSASLIASCGGRKVKEGEQVSTEVVVPQELVKTFEVQEYKSPTSLDLPTDKSETMKKEQKKKVEKKKAKSTKKETVLNRRPLVEPAWVGETIWLDVSWLKTRAGEFQLEVLPYKSINDKKVYNFKGTARTADFFAFIYKAVDTVESFVDYEGWFPYKFTLNGDETRWKRNYIELYDHPNKKQYVHVINQKVKTGEVDEDKGYKELTPLAQDSISAVYYVRTQNLEIGKVIKFPMTANGRVWDTEVHVVEKEEIDTKAGRMKAIKTKVMTYFKGNLEQKGDAFLWFSDDDRKYLLKFEAKVKIGWVAGVVKKIEPGTPPEQTTSNFELAPEYTKSPSESKVSWLEKEVQKIK